ncbi:oligosaccharide flippase family protein [Solirubrobacter sp. CPCC 204708]|uniref:Oligosaccharide flippase family protein n=1 Tax=Solirubrobacter deserti TaxID=2282478 RepID=A0ABT4RMX6_9ACTN|nr:oligosaccharide flippase family protein [Solirubrobacter deserti]MBE2317977.1 oligosaccharide flippase family protein [Solirubrobacter deserti]MDA0139656.1 oligosaccharide flippase family protein [Solirubrobacter deserti]
MTGIEPPLGSGDSVQELRRRAFTGVLAIALRSLAIRGMGLAASVVLARELTPTDFGLAAFGLSIVGIGAFFTAGGIGAALIQQEREPTKLQLQAVFGFQLAVALVVAVGTFAIGAPLGQAGLIAGIMAFSLPVDVMRSAPAVMTQRELRFGPMVRAEVGEMLVYNVVAVVLVLLGAGVWSLTAAVMCRAVAGTVLLVLATGIGVPRPRWSWGTVKPMLRFGATLQAIDFVNQFRAQGLNFTTAGVAGVSSLGYLDFTMRVLQPLLLLFDAVGRVAFPAVAGLLRAGDDPRPMLEKGLRVAFGATGLGVVTLASATPALVPSVFGPQWVPVIEIVPWCLFALLLSSPIVTCTGAYLTAINQVGLVLRSTILYSIAWAAVGLALLPSYGAVAIAIGWAVAGVVDSVYLTRALRSRLPSVRIVHSAAPTVLIAALVAPIGWLIESAMGPTLLAAAAAAVSAAVLYTLLLGLVRREMVLEGWTIFRRIVLRRG